MLKEKERPPGLAAGACKVVDAGAIEASSHTPKLLQAQPSGHRLFDDPAEVLRDLRVLDQAGIAWLTREGVTPAAIMGELDCLRLALGTIAADDVFDPDPTGAKHVAVAVRALDGDLLDIGFWQPRTGRLGSYCGKAWALGQEAADNPSLGFAGRGLTVQRDPLAWLRAGREGIVIIRPDLAAWHLRRLPRLVAADVRHGRALRRAIMAGLPKILVRQAA